MNKFQKATSVLLASTMVMSMFASVNADTDPMNTGYCPSGVEYDYGDTSGYSRAGLDFEYYNDTPICMKVNFSPVESQYRSEQVSLEQAIPTFNECFLGSYVTCPDEKYVYLDYGGTEERPLIYFDPMTSTTYDFEFGQSMRGVFFMEEVDALRYLKVDTVSPFYAVFRNYSTRESNDYITLPEIKRNDSSDLTLEFQKIDSRLVFVPESYAKVDLRINNSDKIQEIVLPNGLDNIDNYAFLGDTALTTVNIPETVSIIEYSAFMNTKSLQELEMPNSVKEIKPDAFIGSKITDIYFNGTQDEWNKIKKMEFDFTTNPDGQTAVYATLEGILTDHEITVHCLKDSTNVILPVKTRSDEVPVGDSGYCPMGSSIPGFMWYLDKGAMHVIVGENRNDFDFSTTLGFTQKLSEASTLCLASEVEIDDWIELKFGAYEMVDKQMDIEVSAGFDGNVYLPFLTNVNKVSFGENKYIFLGLNHVDNKMPEIGSNYAEYARIDLGTYDKEDLVVPKCYDNVAFHFADAKAVKNAEFADGIKTIKCPGLAMSDSLADVKLPDTLETIEYLSFSNCKSLKSINMPGSIKTIHDTAFANNESFTDIYYDGYKADWDKVAIIKNQNSEATDKLSTKKEVTIHFKEDDVITNPSGGDDNPGGNDNNPGGNDNNSGKTRKPRNELINDFVKRLYKDVLGRESDPSGEKYWIDRVSRFECTGADVAKEFLFSKELKDKKLTNSQFVDILYIAFFGREADKEGKEYWVGLLDAGASREEVARGFIFSVEWANTCAEYGIYSGSDTKPDATVEPTEELKAFVTRLYACALNRQPDDEGLKYWCGELANFRLTGRDIALLFFTSAEFKGYNLSNTEFVDRLYKTFMDRTPDEAGLAYWVDLLDKNATRESVIDCFSKSEEFVSLCEASGIKPY
ncbi:MAG: DUF4214 domain-containing protein [Clostridiales bacterium]|nr:DUF4214 domain-containing protein [Clostridiales bacterium]